MAFAGKTAWTGCAEVLCVCAPGTAYGAGGALLICSVDVVAVVSGVLLSSLLQAASVMHSAAVKAAADVQAIERVMLRLRSHARRAAAKRLLAGLDSNNALRADLVDMGGL
jgi:hypothetical protein